MRRFTPLNVAAALVVTALVAALVANGAGAGAATDRDANPPAAAGSFHQTLAAKLGEQLREPAAEVRAALRRAHRLTRRAHRWHARRDAWAAAVAQPLGLTPADVTAALRALVAERLDSLVRDGWMSLPRRDAELACFDDASRCAGLRRPPGRALLRVAR